MQVLDGSLKHVFPYTFPHVLGEDLVGTIVGCGEGGCSRLNIGDRVWANLGVSIEGAWAGYATLPEANAVLAPKLIGDLAAATLPVVGMTMLQAFDYGASILSSVTRRAANQSVVVRGRSSDPILARLG